MIHYFSGGSYPRLLLIGIDFQALTISKRRGAKRQGGVRTQQNRLPRCQSQFQDQAPVACCSCWLGRRTARLQGSIEKYGAGDPSGPVPLHRSAATMVSIHPNLDPWWPVRTIKYSPSRKAWYLRPFWHNRLIGNPWPSRVILQSSPHI